MALKKIAILRTGEFTAKNGKKVKITGSTLDKIVNATKEFSYQNDTFPVVLGHPKEDDPAYGNIPKTNLKKENDILYAEVDPDKHLVKEFVETVREGKYTSVSVSLRPDWSIKHLGFLGAVAPAVTGLPKVELSEKEEDTVLEFAELEVSKWPFEALKRVLRNVKEYFIEKEGVEKANKIISEFELEEVGVPPLLIDKKKSNNELNDFSEKEGEKNMDIEAIKEENNSLKAENEALKAAEKRREYVEFIEGQQIITKVKPADREKLVELMCLVDSGEIEFSEEDGNKVKFNPLETLKELIKNQPDIVEFSEVATKTKSPKQKDDFDLGSEIASLVNN